MHYTIEKLMFSDEPVQDYFVAARNKWKEILDEYGDGTIEELAQKINTEQFWFEQNCGTRWPGQEIMAWSVFGYLYATAKGFEDNQALAEKVAKAFQASICSVEVKGHAEEAAEFYMS